jgi:hypothetical protein
MFRTVTQGIMSSRSFHNICQISEPKLWCRQSQSAATLCTLAQNPPTHDSRHPGRLYRRPHRLATTAVASGWRWLSLIKQGLYGPGYRPNGCSGGTLTLHIIYSQDQTAGPVFLIPPRYTLPRETRKLMPSIRYLRTNMILAVVLLLLQGTLAYASPFLDL